MGFAQSKKQPRDLLPPPLEGASEETDCFGLPLRFCFLEDDETREARIGQTRTLIEEAAEAVIRQVGRLEARRLFRAALRAPKEGKRPNMKENALRLAAYDRARSRGASRERAALTAADEMATRPDDDPQSIAKHIRKLVRDREAYEARLKKFPPSVLDTADGQMSDL
jgi:hypothetical protein